MGAEPSSRLVTTRPGVRHELGCGGDGAASGVGRRAAHALLAGARRALDLAPFEEDVVAAHSVGKGPAAGSRRAADRDSPGVPDPGV